MMKTTLLALALVLTSTTAIAAAAEKGQKPAPTTEQAPAAEQQAPVDGSTEGAAKPDAS